MKFFIKSILFKCFHLSIAHMKRIQSSEINQSVQSLSVLMPSLADQIIRDQPDEDSMHTTSSKYEKIYLSDDINAEIYNLELMDQDMEINANVKDNSSPVAVNNRKKSLSLKQKELFKLSSIAQKCFLVFVLLSIILLGIVMGCSVWIIQLKKTKYIVPNETANNNETGYYVKISPTRFHEIIEDLMDKMRQVMLKRLYEIEKTCIEKSNLDPGATLVPPSADPYPTFVEDLACLKACYKCIDERLSSSVSFPSNRYDTLNLFLFFSVKKEHPINVGHYAIVLIGAQTHQ